MEILKTGDPCPCCGKPIKSDDQDVLLLLSWIQHHQRLPSPAEVAGLYRMFHPKDVSETILQEEMQ